MHGSQRRFDVTGVERPIGGLEKMPYGRPVLSHVDVNRHLVQHAESIRGGRFEELPMIRIKSFHVLRRQTGADPPARSDSPLPCLPRELEGLFHDMTRPQLELLSGPGGDGGHRPLVAGPAPIRIVFQDELLRLLGYPVLERQPEQARENQAALRP